MENPNSLSTTAVVNSTGVYSPSPPSSDPSNRAGVIVSLIKMFCKGASVISGAYLFGVFGISPSWLLMGLVMWMVRENHLKKKQDRIAHNQAAVTNEKAAVLARLEDLPSWVYFPDVERAEWINKILHKMWPYIGHYVEDLLRTKVEPSVRESLPSYLRSFRFEKIVLGDMPPRVGGVKVYEENVGRDEIIMDLEILYSGDSNFLVGVKGLKAGIKDVQ
ncbi:extended synaptotagmin-3-like, partial [Limulus polyphemus]|uniref:Extended synaptotagmin-3-like n=1 Tax=Limulus polyphemus TaxID=6850 RepID=A0ABM1BU18_LIMPO